MATSVRSGWCKGPSVAVASIFFALAISILGPRPAHAIPAFARKYGLPCSACHEAWPKLNSFGQSFRDYGYQLMNDRDAPIYQQPSYWPAAMRITPHWHFETSTRQAIDSIPGDATSPTIEGNINYSSFDLTGIDLLTGGTLAKNVSFLLVPSIADVNTISFESAWVRLDNVFGTRWLNFKFGKHEIDLPISEKRILTLSDNGGFYQIFHFAPPGDTLGAVWSMADNQLGIELVGHSKNDLTRYAVSLLSSNDGQGPGVYPSVTTGRSYDGYIHVSQGFLLPKFG